MPASRDDCPLLAENGLRRKAAAGQKPVIESRLKSGRFTQNEAHTMQVSAS